MDKLVVCIMGQNCEKFIPMCLESVKEADAIVYCDGGSYDETIDYLYTKDFKKDGWSQAENKIIIENDVIAPIFSNFADRIYPYVSLLFIMYSLNLVLIIVILFLIIIYKNKLK